jgi:molybdopterin biosynthesis enzyme
VKIVPWQNSADLAALAAANCLVVLPAEPLQLDSGSVVPILLI